MANFKNYESASLELSETLNCFVGENGMGKTNLLDAIHCLCMGKSHFALTDAALIRQGEDFFRLVGEFQYQDESEQLVVKYERRKKKVIEKNKLPYQRFSEHVGRYPLVMIAPDDSQLILDGSEERRRFLDFSLVQLDRDYLNQLLVYNKILDQRNALLKAAENPQQVDLDLLAIYDAQLLEPAAYIFEKRKAFCLELVPVFQDYYAAISGNREVVELEYQSNLTDSSLQSLLEETRTKDMILQRTSRGIHKDDLDLKLNEFPLKRYASQGQLKSYLLAMKLAQYELLRLHKEVSPILLLDDIFDKLDELRVKQLLVLLLERSFGQIFITDTHQERVDAILESVKFRTEYKKYKIEFAKVLPA